MSNVSSVIKSIQDIMRKDVGVDGDAQRISQLVWMFFLKIFDHRFRSPEFARYVATAQTGIASEPGPHNRKTDSVAGGAATTSTFETATGRLPNATGKYGPPCYRYDARGNRTDTPDCQT